METKYFNYAYKTKPSRNEDLEPLENPGQVTGFHLLLVITRKIGWRTNDNIDQVLVQAIGRMTDHYEQI